MPIGRFLIVNYREHGRTSQISAPRRALDQTFGIHAGAISAQDYEWPRRLLELKVVLQLGKMSYKMYPWHFSVYSVSPTLIAYWSIALIVALPTTALVASIAYQLPNRPFSGIQKHFSANQRAGAQVFSHSEFVVVAQKQLGTQMEGQSQ